MALLTRSTRQPHARRCERRRRARTRGAVRMPFTPTRFTRVSTLRNRCTSSVRVADRELTRYVENTVFRDVIVAASTTCRKFFARVYTDRGCTKKRTDGERKRGTGKLPSKATNRADRKARTCARTHTRTTDCAYRVLRVGKSCKEGLLAALKLEYSRVKRPLRKVANSGHVCQRVAELDKPDDGTWTCCLLYTSPSPRDRG